MGKRIIILLLVLIASSLWADRPFSKINNVEKIIELANDIDLMIEGEIISKEAIYIHRNVITEERLPWYMEFSNYNYYWYLYKYRSRTGYSMAYNIEKEFYKYIWIEE